MYFARNPGGDIWVWFGDLSDEIQTKLFARLHEERDVRNRLRTRGINPVPSDGTPDR